MVTIRRLVFGISFLMGVWVFSSFVGVMLNMSNVEFWTTSLMWALLASVFVMPALVVALHASNRSARKVPQQQKQRTTPPVKKQPPFISEEAQEDVLWPEFEKDRSSEE